METSYVSVAEKLFIATMKLFGNIVIKISHTGKRRTNVKPERSKELNTALTAQLKSIAHIKTSQRTQHTAIIEALRKTYTVMRLIAEELGMKPLPKPPAEPEPAPKTQQATALEKAKEIAEKIKGDKKS